MTDAAQAFDAAITAIRALPVRPDILLSEAPAPTRLAPHAHAVTAEVGEPEVGSGRFVLLHDPSRPAAWEADTRVVVYAEADIDPEMVEDQLLTDVGWTWLQESLDEAGARYSALGGTVTGVRSTSYEALSARGQESTIQIRAAWSAPGLFDITAHWAAWLGLLTVCADLPPFHPDVTLLGDRR